MQFTIIPVKEYTNLPNCLSSKAFPNVNCTILYDLLMSYRFTLLSFYLLCQVLAHGQKIHFSNGKEITNSKVIAFAKKEIIDCLKRKQIKSDLVLDFTFLKNAALVNGSFSYAIEKTKTGFQISLSGEGATEILHASHSFLEHLGYRFELNGTVDPEKLIMDTLTSGYYEVQPYTRWRGIRQHVNFPMDISSYPIEEAKEYLNRLVRMRFNEIAVHSYPNLWHEVYTGDSTEKAGNFFYNRPHEIPDIPLIKEHIRFNKSYFSIPSIEPYYPDHTTRSKMSVAWMNALLTHAKNIGLKVHFSIEPRTRGDINYIIDNCRSAIKNYPMIDELEINTEELGGWGNTCSDSTVKRVLVSRFGDEVLKDTFVTNRIQKSQTDLDNLMEQIGRNITAVKLLSQDSSFRSKNIKLKLGIYCTIVPHADLAYHLVRKYLPETALTIMPGHGSVRTSQHFSRINKTVDDLKQTTIFSWIEFDGLMFTQQNPIAGIESLFKHLDTIKGKIQSNSILFNHWRTAENAIAARFAALSSLHGPMNRKEFYRQYAAQYQFASPELFAALMEELETIDHISTNDLPNYGFCWLGAWLNGGPYQWINRETLSRVKKMHESVLDKINLIIKGTPSKSGMEKIAFLQNRIEASIEYIKAFESACQLQDLKKESNGTYTTEDKKKAISIFDQAFVAYERYMQIHTQLMPDRGSEGTLINLWHGPIYGLKVLREKILGIPVSSPISSGINGEGPPLPIFYH